MYYLLLKEEGEGCDYTIGCGMVYRQLKAKNPAAALVEAQEVIDYYGGIDRIETAILITASDVTPLPLDDYRREAGDAAAEAAKAEIERSERAEYERLRAKFGPSVMGD